MALTPSTMIPLGTPCPDFRLPEPGGVSIARDDLDEAPALLVMFLCNHCPYVKHVAQELAAIGRDYGARGVGIVAINSNDVTTHPDDHPDRMIEEKRAAGYPFPYLFDEDQATARAFDAACTPDFFLFDAQRRLFYRGQLDDARPDDDRPVTGADLRSALDAVLASDDPPAAQVPSMGCNIKWRP